MTRIKGSEIPDPFVLTEMTRAWLEKRYPQVDEELAIERFTAWASNYSYANWQKTFQNFVIRLDDEGRLKLVMKKPKPRKEIVLERARAAGFREPFNGETVDDYEEALRKHQCKNVVPIKDILGAVKRFG